MVNSFTQLDADESVAETGRKASGVSEQSLPWGLRRRRALFSVGSQEKLRGHDGTEPAPKLGPVQCGDWEGD